MAATNSAVAWCHPRLGSYMQTPIVVGPLLWSCDWMGVLTCVDARTGRLHYSERLGKGGQAFTASPVAAKDKLYFASEDGDVFVVRAQESFQVLSTSKLAGSSLATPAVSSGTILFRTTDQLVAIRTAK
jgi:outer membrane protein assembly factor BamB